ncbi:hypothetical protein ACIPY5_16095 [Microbacterium sp. NPDC089698]|uniref:hypothetical protein n=1 Tax=Microbacterium sp. NPDC089698 TaxID=3364200 RepID=UPI00381809F5
MNEPQVWTLIGVFAAGMFGMITIITTMFTRVVRSEISGLRSELNGGLSELRTDLKGDIAELRTEVRNIDRDVSALMKHTFGIDRD